MNLISMICIQYNCDSGIKQTNRVAMTLRIFMPSLSFSFSFSFSRSRSLFLSLALPLLHREQNCVSNCNESYETNFMANITTIFKAREMLSFRWNKSLFLTNWNYFWSNFRIFDKQKSNLFNFLCIQKLLQKLNRNSIS